MAMYRQKLNSTQQVPVCRVKAESSKEGKLERKHLLHEGRQLRKQTKLLTAEGGRYPSGYFTVFQDCLSMCTRMRGNFTWLYLKGQTGLCVHRKQVSGRQSLPLFKY